jgi:hypothetical protein
MYIQNRNREVLMGLFAVALCTNVAAQAVSETSFTYQGSLQQGGQQVTEQCDFEFSLWTGSNNPDPGVQVGTELQLTSDVDKSVFNAELDFGADVMNGDARWLHIAVCCASPCAPAYTDLAPRQAITSAPYSIQTRGIYVNDNGDVGIGTTAPNHRLKVVETGQRAAIFGVAPSWYAIRGQHSSTGGSFPGVWGDTNSAAANASGVRGYINSASPGSGSSGVRGINQGTNSSGAGVHGTHAGTGIGVLGQVFQADGWAGYFSGGRNYFQGRVGIGTEDPSSETMLHAQVTGDDFGVLVNAAGSASSWIGLHTGPSGYSSLAKNAFFSSGWKKFNISGGSFLQQINPDGEVTFMVSPTGLGDSISWTKAMTIRPDGKIGMGTENPSQKLHVIGNALVQGSSDLAGDVKVQGVLDIGLEIVQIDCTDCRFMDLTCPAGKKLTGGGCSADDPLILIGPRTQLNRDDVWGCWTDGDSAFIVAYAICARVK